jgi:hypothetical protein
VPDVFGVVPAQFCIGTVRARRERLAPKADKSRRRISKCPAVVAL